MFTVNPMNRNEPSATRKLFLSAVLELFRQGMDTVQIAAVLEHREYTIERALHEALTLSKKEKAEPSG